jgi:hypothetical protein
MTLGHDFIKALALSKNQDSLSIDANKLSPRIIPLELSTEHLLVNGLLFLPGSTEKVVPYFALMTHGFTSHKGSILNWAQRLCAQGICSLVFDLPGHYLGNFHDVPSFEIFKKETLQLYSEGLKKIQFWGNHFFPLETDIFNPYLNSQHHLFILGHSLGALMGLRVLSEKIFHDIKITYVGVGLSFSFSDDISGTSHILETDFYKKTLMVREQLVHPVLQPKVVFPWIKSTKEKIISHITGQEIYLITGEDDVVATPKQVEHLGKSLQENGNWVKVIVEKKLSHHLPENAARMIAQIAKEKLNFKN